MPTSPHILLVVENNPVPGDVRVWAEACTLREAGYRVTVISPRGEDQPWVQRLRGVTIYRYPQWLEAHRPLEYIPEYLNSFFWTFFLAVSIFLTSRFHVIHAANPPDFFFLIATLFKPLGVRFVFDHHDLSPEVYQAKFEKRGFAHKILLFAEFLSFRAADLVISTNDSYKQIALTRGRKRPEQVFTVRNGPDLTKIRHSDPNHSLKSGFDHLVVYLGLIDVQDGVDNLLHVVKHLVYEKGIRNTKFLIVGSGPKLRDLMHLCTTLGLSRFVQFTGYLEGPQLREALATADLCVDPEFRTAFSDKSTMIKVMEYMAFGKPIVQFYKTEGEVSAGDSAVYVRSNNIAAFADAVTTLLGDPETRKRMGQIAERRILGPLNWQAQQELLRRAYGSLIENTSSHYGF